MSDVKLVCKNVWKIFGANPKRVLDNHDRSKSRAEIQAETGHVVAVKDVSFEVKKGECFVVMGLSGSGKSTLVGASQDLSSLQVDKLLLMAKK